MALRHRNIVAQRLQINNRFNRPWHQYHPAWKSRVMSVRSRRIDNGSDGIASRTHAP
jgi:hypothetical protein